MLPDLQGSFQPYEGGVVTQRDCSRVLEIIATCVFEGDSYEIPVQPPVCGSLFVGVGRWWPCKRILGCYVTS